MDASRMEATRSKVSFEGPRASACDLGLTISIWLSLHIPVCIITHHINMASSTIQCFRLRSNILKDSKRNEKVGVGWSEG
jgi:hypothetical protein